MAVVPSGLCSAGMSFQPFCPCHPHVGLSSHVMPSFLPMSSLRWAERWLGIYGQKASRHLWLRFCLHCPAIRKEEGRLSHTLGKVLARCWHTQPYPLSMARAKEEREKGEGMAREMPGINLPRCCLLMSCMACGEVFYASLQNIVITQNTFGRYIYS